MLRALALLTVLAAAPSPASAEALRIATYDAGLSRNGAGMLLRELGRDPKPELAAALAVIRAARPDILLLTRFDHDPKGRALAAFRDLLARGGDGIAYPHMFTAPVNAGMASGLDLNGDGLDMGPGDALGWGRYPGHGGMAILSRHEIDTGAMRSFRDLRWADLPGATMPTRPDGTPWPNAETAPELRLSSRSHWDVPVRLPGGARLHLLAANPTPPLFDGPERANQLRNRDEIGLWTRYLDGVALVDDSGHEAATSDAPVVVLGNLNADPADGEGIPDGIRALLTHPRLQDPRPSSPGGAAAADPGHEGPPALDTADWSDPPEGPGNLRVDYVLPDARLTVLDAGALWPEPGSPLAALAGTASPHRLVWVDIALP